ncbi:hypothetical protein [Nostoc sp.]|uniref:hypothetical protein n=1 Tax=Nostoc sp. TaxID=1180 RepID=UPI002FF9F042
MAIHDLTGQRFVRLVVQQKCQPPKEYASKTTWWMCLCDCGNTKAVRGTHLKRGGVQSCGCLQKENLSVYPSTHGCTGSPCWYSWRGMLDRCRRENSTSWERYGGKGIKVCDRWQGDNGFENFLMDMGERPEGKTLDRIDSSGDYCPKNCRWATPKEQRLNTSRTRWMTYDGKTLCLSDWASELGMDRNTLNNRLNKGWSIEKTLSTPPRW